MSQLKLDSPGRRKIKYCPCGKKNRDGKFTPFAGHDRFGHCHACDKTLFPPEESESIMRFPKLRMFDTKQELPITIIPNELVRKTVEGHFNVNLITWLSCKSRINKGEIPLTTNQVKDIVKRYRIRGSDVYRGGVAFVYIDINSNVRQIKVMGYDVATGKRVKEPFPEVMQIGRKIMVDAGRQDVNIVPCFFGEHLLAKNNSDVYVFESEATAIYASVFFPEQVCIATGGKNGCKWDKPEQFNVLKDRRVVLWPDIDAHEEWQLKAELLRKAGIDVYVEDSIVNAAISQSQITGISYEAYKALKFDLRDILIYKEPVTRHSAEFTNPPVSGAIALSSGLTGDVTQGSGAIVAIPEKTKSASKFDIEEYKAWFDSVSLPSYPIEVDGNLQIYNAADFVFGRLNHIRAFTKYRKPGNRSEYIYQLQQLRNRLG